ncbi:tetratricopeptide repeat protein [Phenylobacterium sp.]|uniref:tetratricopeptide repeat protein n=1 Tax=Phenylobacterium sp. TaxID=1871053 RepID=UPI00273634C0|nr:tetratricopeptide repeat protein [Phenylobacterium sp.]MDP3855670.1 tetratricopeptide repeat protein [Phenylobacterium sp.]
MCRMSALAATALAPVLAPILAPILAGALLAAAAPAAALPWSKAKPAAAAPAKAATPAPAAPRRKATPAERAAVARSEPLARAAFWARELDADGGDVEAGVQLSQALRSLQNYGDAVAAIQRTLAVSPDSVEALLELAKSHVGRGQGFYAIDPARRVQQLNPRDWRAPSLLGVAYEQAQRDEEALAAHRLALRLAPENPSVISNLALFQATHGQPAEAEALLRQAIARPGAPIAVRQNLALVLGLQGRLDEAEKLARQDLPPELVASNMAWLRAATSTAPAGRSWQDVGRPQ